jgi:hypothetical protein
MEPARYSPSRYYFTAASVALGLALFCAWWGASWNGAYVPSALFVISSAVLFFLASRPAIEISDDALRIGARVIPWAAVRRVDSTGYTTPLAVHLTLADGERILLLYPGELESASRLMRHLHKRSKNALIDGIPHREIWGDPALPPAKELKQLPSPRYPLLLPEDEAEVERIYQRLRAERKLGNKRKSTGEM